MKITKLLTIVLIFSSIFFLGCPPKKIEEKKYPVERIIQRVKENNSMIKSIRGNGEIDVSLKNFNNKADFELSLLKNDSLKVNIFGPFGIEVANVLITPKRTVFLNNFSNQVVIAETKNTNLRELIRINLDFNGLMNILTGVVDLPEDNYDNIDAVVDGNDYFLSYLSNDTLYKYWIDIRYMVVSKANVSFRDKILYEVSFSKFYDLAGAVVPKEIQMKNYESNDRFKITYKDLYLNAKQLDFKLIIPEDAEIRKW